MSWMNRGKTEEGKGKMGKDERRGGSRDGRKEGKEKTKEKVRKRDESGGKGEREKKERRERWKGRG